MRSPANRNGAPQPSLSRVVRDVQQQFAALQTQLSPPSVPLPTAECVAAFVDGNATEAESDEVIRATVHDLGILLQVTQALQNVPEHPQAVSAELVARLTALRQTPSMDSHSSVLPSNTQAVTEPPMQTSLGDAAQPAERSRRGSGWTMLAVAVAACLLLAVGWRLWSGSGRSDVSPPDRRVAENLNSRPPEEQDTEEQDAQGPIENAPPELVTNPPAPDQPGSDTDIDRAMDNLQQQIVRQADQGAASESDDQQSAMDESVVAQPSTTPSPMSDGSLEPAIEWRQVTGILARQTEQGYDKWQAVSSASLHRADDRSADPDAMTSWLTLPTCYARGVLTGGGQVVMNQDSRLSAQIVSPETTLLQLEFGSVALLDVPVGRKFRLDGAGTTANELEVVQPARLHVRRVPAGFAVAVESGQATYQGRPWPRRRVLLIRADGTEIGGPLAVPEWASQFPTSSVLSRKLLASFDKPQELGQAIEQQLVTMARSLNPNNQLGMANFRKLCLWRAKLSVEDNTAVVQHPLWFVRTAAFDVALSTTDHLPSLQARRQLAARLQAATLSTSRPSATAPTAITNQARPQQQKVTAQQIRNWIETSKGNRQPSRQDLANWLSLLTGEDRVVAAFADYLLRKRFANGPAFDPAAAPAVRARSQQAWRSVITGNG